MSTERATISGLSHVGIVVPDLDAAARRLEEAFGVTAGPVLENAAQGVKIRRIMLGAAYLELLQPTDEQGSLHRFLARNPSGGLHHIGLGTPDLDLAVSAACGVGVSSVGSPALNVDGDRILFLKPSSLLGTLIELVESPRPASR